VIHISERITVVDALEQGACWEGVKKFVSATGLIAGNVIDLKGEAKDWFYGYGYGSGYGSGSGYGYGDGYGDGYGYGDGDGYGDGYGYG